MYGEGLGVRFLATEQLEHWQGEFGDAYTQRNTIDWQARLPAWQHMLDGLALEHVVEIGCNRAHNLRALAETGKIGGNIIGIEPNQRAIEMARRSSPTYSVLHGNAFQLPFVDGYADLVFTVGVLIHIAPVDLARALSEMYRVSRRYLLCAEYFAEDETVVEYRGHTNLLWKRDFRQSYLDQFPTLNVVKEGYWGEEYGFDRVTWWLFEK